MKLHLPTPTPSPSLSTRSVSFAADSSTTTTNTTTPLSSIEEEEDEADLVSLFGEPNSFDQDGAADRSAMATPPTEEDDFESLFGEDETPDQDNLAGSNTSTEARPETELTLANNPAAPRMTLHLPLAPAGMIAQEENVAGSSSSRETVAGERMDPRTAEALLRAAGELGTPTKRKRGRPPGPGVKPKQGPVWYRCRYGCAPQPDKDGIHRGMKGVAALRKHMRRVHGVFSNQAETVLVHHCGRRYSPTAAVNCSKQDVTCKALVQGTAEWYRHHVQAPCTEQEAADCFAYASGVQPSEMVIVLPHHVEEEQSEILRTAYDESVARATAAAEAAAKAKAAAEAEATIAAQAAAVAEGGVVAEADVAAEAAAGSSQDQAIALDDDDEEEEDAEFELEEEYEQGPAKRRRV